LSKSQASSSVISTARTRLALQLSIRDANFREIPSIACKVTAQILNRIWKITTFAGFIPVEKRSFGVVEVAWSKIVANQLVVAGYSPDRLQ
jgi:hypothetical protein